MLAYDWFERKKFISLCTLIGWMTLVPRCRVNYLKSGWLHFLPRFPDRRDYFMIGDNAYQYRQS